MKIRFLGADKSVTGSCHCLEVNNKKILIDYGMQQGKDEKIRNNELDVDVNEIDAVVITHAHIDHTGRLPLLIKSGYSGNIYATEKTIELMNIMLKDSAHIQEMEAEWKTRKNKRAGGENIEPLYDIEDVEKTILKSVPVEYNSKFTLFEGIDIILKDSGHLLGSSSVKFICNEDGKEKTVVFSGDIGNYNIPLIKDPEYFEEADYVVMETTYGSKYHDKNEDYVNKLAEIFRTTFKRGGNVVIPSFSVGRTQELLYYIREIKEKKLVDNFIEFPVYIDSPLSQKATGIYDSADHIYFDKETNALINKGINPIKFDNLILTQTTDESIAINNDDTPKVIISSSGMCEAGRIRHHLKHNLWRQDSSIVFVGYQAEGTLGRMLIDGLKEVKLFGEKIHVRSYLYNLKGLSGHADRNGLKDFVNHFKYKPEKIFLVHGEVDNMESFNELLNKEGYSTYMPNYECYYDLDNDLAIDEGVEDIKVEHSTDKFIYHEIYDRYRVLGNIISENNKDKSRLDSLLKDIEKVLRKYTD